jgi:hypothetical protein
MKNLTFGMTTKASSKASARDKSKIVCSYDLRRNKLIIFEQEYFQKPDTRSQVLSNQGRGRYGK